MNIDFTQKIALITGGTTGIGLAIAKAFVSAHATVVICGRDKKKLEIAEQELNHSVSKKVAFGQVCDVTKKQDLEELIRFIEREFGGLDILINNAGTGSEETVMESSDDKWYYYLDLHLMAAIRLARLAVPLMKLRDGEGSILHVTSICATQPLHYEPIYNVTKSALNMFSKCLAHELIEENIRVNAIAPGLVLTPDWYKTAEILRKEQGVSVEDFFTNIATDMTPIKRFASPEEIAYLALFLCSKYASYCVGSSYYIDGGAIQALQ